MAVNGVTRVSYNPQQMALKPPSEMWGSNPNPVNNQNPYSSDRWSISKAVSTVSNGAVGALSGYKYQGTILQAGKSMSDAILKGGVKDVIGAIGSNTKLLGTAAYNAAGVGAILGGGISILTNGVALAKGEEDGRGAAANVVTDTLGGALSGAGGMLTGGVTAMALSAFKVTGTPLMVGAIIGGAVGATLVNKFVPLDMLNDMIRGN